MESGYNPLPLVVLEWHNSATLQANPFSNQLTRHHTDENVVRIGLTPDFVLSWAGTNQTPILEPAHPNPIKKERDAVLPSKVGHTNINNKLYPVKFLELCDKNTISNVKIVAGFQCTYKNLQFFNGTKVQVVKIEIINQQVNQINL
jgi:hypothetical protein